jgi:hypothetical protein
MPGGTHHIPAVLPQVIARLFLFFLDFPGIFLFHRSTSLLHIPIPEAHPHETEKSSGDWYETIIANDGK